jgi:hypothetical protein
MKIVIQLEVTKDVLEGVFITAIEGGSNYWYSFSESAVYAVDKAVPRDNGKSFSERLFEAVYDHGVVVPVHDVEDTSRNSDPIGFLNRDLFQERINKCAKESVWAINSEMSGDGDAVSSDIVFQYLVLGEVIYG